MQRILKYLLRDEQISSFLRIASCHWGDLACAEAYYTKDGKYYVSRSFYTDTWIANTPFGGMEAANGFLPCSALADVATIFEYTTVKSWRNHKKITEIDLASICFAFNWRAKEIAMEALKDNRYMIQNARFAFIPVPSIVVSLLDDLTFLGAFSIDMHGHAQVATATSSRIYDIVQEINLAPKSIYKEISDVCSKNENS